MTNALALQPFEPSRLSDEQLVVLARRGEHAGYRYLMQRYNRKLYRTARGILGDDSEAEDVVQEAYVRAFRHLASFRGDSAFGTWLTRIAINEALGRKRKRPATVELSHLDALSGQAEPRVILFPGANPNGNPEADVGTREMRRLLERAVDALPEAFRIVFVLREIEQMSVEETARHLDLKPQTVKTRLHRARRLLRSALEKQFGSALQEAYAFDGWRCERLTNTVLRRLEDANVIVAEATS
jgi:RNA polymerase sigma-70 factor (ECF subfamily)